MGDIYNIYCDESCHLENDGQKVMVLGAIWCSTEKVKEISQRIIDIKMRNGKEKSFELKWIKLTSGNKQLYVDLINYFFDDDDLHFRGIVADKTILNHSSYEQTHDEWYYKMYYYLLKTIASPKDNYNVYIDIKDTLSQAKVVKLKDILCNSLLDFDKTIFQKIQQIRSHESTLIQLTDVLIGALSYSNRQLSSNIGKNEIVEIIKNRSGYSLNKSTLYKESKLNLFFWDGTQHV